MLDIRGQEKPYFAEGAEVQFNLDGNHRGRGKIRGRAIEGLLDFWIVEVVTWWDPVHGSYGGYSPETYPWSCISVPHTLLVDRKVECPPEALCRPPEGATQVERWSDDGAVGGWTPDDGKPGLAFSGLVGSTPFAWYTDFEYGRAASMRRTFDRFGCANGVALAYVQEVTP